MSQTLSSILTAWGAVLVSAIGVLFLSIQHKLAAKLHWEMTSAQEEAERTAVEKIVLFVEHWAARELEPTIDRARAKLAKAKELLAMKLPWLADPELEAAIEAALARLGLGPSAAK